MKTGAWLTPRYTERTIFEKDFPAIDVHGLELYCPGCNKIVRLGRKSPMNRVAGWCPRCNRAVSA